MRIKLQKILLRLATVILLAEDEVLCTKQKSIEIKMTEVNEKLQLAAKLIKEVIKILEER